MNQEYLVFTRKWRPKTFDEIIGQEQVVVSLKRAIELNRIMHAYLFSGPKGVGKTTTARVFAKALNCVKGPTINPCNVCNICKEISDGTALDVIEIDGASNRGIDEIRQLREHVAFGAAQGKYKIYIIDEVHMLTKEAFNALLKTLEEPPPHVIFIFATTDPQQIPQTILSRCQQFKFKRLLPNLIFQNLKIIAESEKVLIDDNAILTIAKHADGALRDAQRILDAAITYSGGEKITEEIISNILGIVRGEILKNIVYAILEKDIKAVINYIEKIFEEGYDLKQFVKELIEIFREILFFKIDFKEIQEIYTEEDYNFIKKMAERCDKKTILFYLEKFISLEQALSKSQIANITLEISLIDMILKEQREPNTINVAKGEVKNENKKKDDEYEKNLNEEIRDEKKFIIEDIQEDEEIKELNKTIIAKRWKNLIDRAEAIKETDDFIQALEKCSIVSMEDNILFIVAENTFVYSRLNKKIEVLQKILFDEFKKEIKINLIEKANYIKKVQTQEEIMMEEIKNHPVVKKLQEIFGEFSEIQIKKAN